MRGHGWDMVIWDQQTHDWLELGVLEEVLRAPTWWSVLKTPHFQGRGCGFDLLLGN